MGGEAARATLAGRANSLLFAPRRAPQVRSRCSLFPRAASGQHGGDRIQRRVAARRLGRAGEAGFGVRGGGAVRGRAPFYRFKTTLPRCATSAAKKKTIRVHQPALLYSLLLRPPPACPLLRHRTTTTLTGIPLRPSSAGAPALSIRALPALSAGPPARPGFASAEGMRWRQGKGGGEGVEGQALQGGEVLGSGAYGGFGGPGGSGMGVGGVEGRRRAPSAAEVFFDWQVSGAAGERRQVSGRQVSGRQVSGRSCCPSPFPLRHARPVNPRLSDPLPPYPSTSLPAHLLCVMSMRALAALTAASRGGGPHGRGADGGRQRRGAFRAALCTARP
ncbi:unnamed protein product [Closterium sp. Naga37s-1]|nr:unnamed protein product [Closterium sp. Naga37s-1]